MPVLHDMLRDTILTCAQKLNKNQLLRMSAFEADISHLYLPQETKNEKVEKKTKSTNGEYLIILSYRPIIFYFTVPLSPAIFGRPMMHVKGRL